MAGYLVRIALPDRPGALGLVASRIGAVGGDIVAITFSSAWTATRWTSS
jgi:ACT domain-containing protein